MDAFHVDCDDLVFVRFKFDLRLTRVSRSWARESTMTDGTIGQEKACLSQARDCREGTWTESVALKKMIHFLDTQSSRLSAIDMQLGSYATNLMSCAAVGYGVS